MNIIKGTEGRAEVTHIDDNAEICDFFNVICFKDIYIFK